MSKLEELRIEEDRAQIELEKAEKEAQRIRLSIPELIEEESRKRENKLKEFAQREKAQIEEITSELATGLGNETEKKLKELAENSEILEKAATEYLKKYILKSGALAE